MSRFMVQLHDKKSGRDAFINLDLPKVHNGLDAWMLAEHEVSEAKFEVVSVDEMMTIPCHLEPDVEIDLAQYAQRPAEA